MAEPPAKRQRRTDDLGSRDEERRNGDRTTERNGVRDGERYSRDRPQKSAGRQDQARPRSRSRDRHEPRNRSKDRERDRDYGERGGGRGGDDRSGRGGGRDRTEYRDRRERDERGSERTRRGMVASQPRPNEPLMSEDDPRKERHRTRSRSPVRERDATTRSGARQRTPPHAPRANHAEDRPTQPRNTTDQKKPVPSKPVPSKPTTNGTSAASRKQASQAKADTSMDVDTPLDSEDELQAQMQKMMGFGKFKSTKNTKVPGNDKLYAVRKEKKIEYRQYMNRVGGFNRPLSPSRD